MSAWMKRKIGDLLNNGTIVAIQDGNHGETHPTSSDYITEGEKIPFVMANNVSANKVDLDNCKFIPKTLGFSPQ